MRCPLRCVLLE